MKVLSRWHHLEDNFNTSTLDFYQAVETVFGAREVPDCKTSRVSFHEAGIVSAKREYLRIERGSLQFDLCAAPYGTGYFFSWWLSRPGPKHPLLWLLLLLFAVLSATALSAAIFRDSCMMFVVVPLMPLFTLAALGYMAKEGVFGPDENVLEIPVVGWLYKLFFNPVSYFALDSALMFQESVSRAVGEVLNTVLSEQGIRTLSNEELKPTLRGLAG